MRTLEQSKEGREIVGRRVPLRVRMEGADEVAIAGDFNQWDMRGNRLSHDGAGTWRTVLDLPPGEHQYRLFVDGKWRDDPDAKRRVPNPFGSGNCILVVE